MFARASAVLVVLVAMVLLCSPSGLGQGKKGKGKGRGDQSGAPGANTSGFKGFDLKKNFDQNAPGGFFIIADSKWGKDDMEKFAQSQGITNGKLNFEQYSQYFEQKKKDGGFKKGDGNGPGGFRQGDRQGEKPQPEKSAAELKKMAEDEFKKRDLNGDGVLNYAEIETDPVLRRELAHWDKNNDQMIDLNEFTAYFIESYQKAEREKSQAGATTAADVVEDDLDIRPIVFRYGKLPKDLPEWFVTLDTNKDGLVSLAEWRKGNKDKDLDEFAAMDRDGDGLLTPEEVLRYQYGGEAPPNSQLAGAGRGPGGNMGAGRPGGVLGALGNIFGGKKGKGQFGDGKGQFGEGKGQFGEGGKGQFGKGKGKGKFGG